MFERLEAPGGVRLVFHGIELTLAHRIVIGDSGSGVTSGDSEVPQQVQIGIGRHLCVTILVNGHLFNLVSIGGLTDELLSQSAVVFTREHPVYDAIEGKTDSARLKGQFAYIPCPNLIGSGGLQPGNWLRSRRPLGSSIAVLPEACYVPNYLRLPRPFDSGIFKGNFRHPPLTIARQRQA